jgi:hypothetical protein
VRALEEAGLASATPSAEASFHLVRRILSPLVLRGTIIFATKEFLLNLHRDLIQPLFSSVCPTFVVPRAAGDGGSPEATLNIAAAVATLSEFAIPSMGITTAASAASTTSARRHRAPRPSLESPERPARAVVCSATTTHAPSAFVSVTASAAFSRHPVLSPLCRLYEPAFVSPPSCRKPPILARETHRRAGKCRRCCSLGHAVQHDL